MGDELLLHFLVKFSPVRSVPVNQVNIKVLEKFLRQRECPHLVARMNIRCEVLYDVHPRKRLLTAELAQVGASFVAQFFATGLKPKQQFFEEPQVHADQMFLLGEVELPLTEVIRPHQSQCLDLLHPIVASFLVLLMVVEHRRYQATPLALVLHLVSQDVKNVLPALIKTQHFR